MLDVPWNAVSQVSFGIVREISWSIRAHEMSSARTVSTWPCSASTSAWVCSASLRLCLLGSSCAFSAFASASRSFSVSSALLRIQ